MSRTDAPGVGPVQWFPFKVAEDLESKFKNHSTQKNPHAAQFIVLPQAAHSVNWESSRAFNRNVLEFIRRY